MWTSMAICSPSLEKAWLRSAEQALTPSFSWLCSWHSSGLVCTQTLTFLFRHCFLCFSKPHENVMHAGSRCVLPDVRVFHDSYVQRRTDGDGPFLHLWGCCFCQSYGGCQCNGKQNTQTKSHDIHQSTKQQNMTSVLSTSWFHSWSEKVSASCSWYGNTVTLLEVKLSCDLVTNAEMCHISVPWTPNSLIF